MLRVECPDCGRANREDARFCDECGAGLARGCTQCGRELRPDARFCDGCGASTASATAAAGAPEPSPDTYTPRHLKERILTTRAALEGERKQVTVLFADIKNSVGLSAETGAEEWHRILDRFFSLVAEGVHRFEGTINQYTGDGVMALFGAPLAHEDHAQRACYASLQLTESVRAYGQELRREHGIDFQMRIGLNSGDVVVGKIGDDLRMDYTAQGETVGLASRLQELAETGRPYLGPRTAELVRGYVALEDLGDFKLKGAPAPVRVFGLEGMGSVRTRLDLSRARGFSRFVGRDREIAALELALERVIDGQGQVLGLVADAGVGKSRLCLEFVESCHARDIPVHEAHAVSHGKTIPNLPVLELLRGVFGIADEDTEREARQKIAGAVFLRDESLHPDLPLLFDMLLVPDPERPPPPLEPDARQEKLRHLLVQLLQARSQEEPGVYLIEDLHWLDPSSEAFLADMVDAIPSTRSLVLVNFRPEYSPPWSAKSYYQQLPLVPLGPDAMRELLAHLLGSDASLSELSQQVAERAAGNPFFIEEMVRALEESGALEGSRGAYRLTRPVHELALPSQVEAILSARIDRLPERAKRLLQTASVIGREFSRTLLARVAELPEPELDDALRELVASEFVHERQLYPEVEYGFKHPLTCDAAYATLLQERRRGIHALVARSLEVLEADRLDERAALIGYHWESADEAFAAARWYARGIGPGVSSHVSDAVRQWRKVHELGARFPDTPEAIQLRLEAVGRLLSEGSRLGLEPSEIHGLVGEGREFAAQLEDPAALARFLMAAGNAVAINLGVGEGAAYFRESIERADESGDPQLRREARVRAALILSLGGSGEALELALTGRRMYAEAIASGEQVPPNVAPYNSMVLGQALCWSGRLEEGRHELKLAVEGTARAGDDSMHYLSLSFSAICDAAAGEPAAALAHARQAVEAAERVGSLMGRCFTRSALGSAHSANAEFAEATEVLEDALELGRQHRANLALSRTLSNLAEALIGVGRSDEALERAREAITECDRQGNTLFGIDARRVLAAALRARDGLSAEPEALAALDEASRSAEQADSFPHGIAEERARWAALRGDSGEFERRLREAHASCLKAGAHGHARRLAAELATLEVSSGGS